MPGARTHDQTAAQQERGTTIFAAFPHPTRSRRPGRAIERRWRPQTAFEDDCDEVLRKQRMRRVRLQATPADPPDRRGPHHPTHLVLGLAIGVAPHANATRGSKSHAGFHRLWPHRAIQSSENDKRNDRKRCVRPPRAYVAAAPRSLAMSTRVSHRCAKGTRANRNPSRSESRAGAHASGSRSCGRLCERDKLFQDEYVSTALCWLRPVRLYEAIDDVVGHYQGNAVTTH